jgi:6-phosphofructokinase
VLGVALGSVKFRGIGLGTAGVLFAGILVGHFGEAVDHQTLDFALSVVGVPKTIDNDVGFVSRTRLLPHRGAKRVGGIGLVKLMGRHAGFITAGAVVVGQDVNFALIPEIPFKVDAILAALKQRMLVESHAVIAVADGAGQDLLAAVSGRHATLPAM